MAMTYFGAENIFNHAVEMNQVADQPIHAFHSSVSRGTANKRNVPRGTLHGPPSRGEGEVRRLT
jgi:hypothetical protein